MRILHVNKFLYRRGGAESYLLDVAHHQQAAGHDVWFWGMRHPENTENELAQFFPSYIELEPAPSGLVARVRASSRMVWSTSSGRGLAAAIEHVRPDVVHFHNVYHQLSPSVVRATARGGVASVMTLHDYKLACPSYQLLAHGLPCTACLDHGLWQAARTSCKDGSRAASTALAAESWLHRRMHAYAGVGVFLCPSRFLHDVMVRADVFPDRMRVVPHFVEAGGPINPGRGGPVVFAGRLSSEKGVDTLVRATPLLPEGSTVTIAGDGPARADLERLADEVAPGRISFVGRLPKTELLRLVAGATAMAVPSRWYENQPMTVLEALTAATPVIASDMGGLPELVRDGVDGRLVPPDDPTALAQALTDLLVDPSLAAEYGRAGRDRMLTDFALDEHLRRLESAYRDAGVRRRGGSRRSMGPGHQPVSTP
jgi:glycosyltransferase involved in cell wall biosynthesis